MRRIVIRCDDPSKIPGLDIMLGRLECRAAIERTGVDLNFVPESNGTFVVDVFRHVSWVRRCLTHNGFRVIGIVKDPNYFGPIDDSTELEK